MTVMAEEGTATSTAARKPRRFNMSNPKPLPSVSPKAAAKRPETPKQQRTRTRAIGREIQAQRRYIDEQSRSRAAERGATGSPGPKGSKGKSTKKSSFSAGRKIGRDNYQPVILAEFVLAVLLVALTPVATKKDTQGLSPYEGKDMVKLASLTLLYFLLALMSVGGRSWGRLGAWFGGLVLIVVGLNEATNLAKVFNPFTQPKAAEGGGGPIKGANNG